MYIRIGNRETMQSALSASCVLDALIINSEQDSDLDVVSQRSEPDFDVNMELNASKTTSIQGLGQMVYMERLLQ